MNVTFPNIVYIVCHDLGRHLGAYGAGVRTPTLDRFAEQGATLRNAVCTSPACSPSRGCAMTGQYAHTNGLMGIINFGWSMPESTLTIVDHLNAAGYETVHTGFQHERWRPEANRYQIERSSGIASDAYVENAVAEAVGYLEQRDRTSPPFYLNIATAEVHDTQWQSSLGGARLDRFGPGPPQEACVPSFLPDVPPIRREMAGLQACVEYMDAQLAPLFEAVERLDDAERTLVVFTTDHGLPGMRGKTTLYVRGVETALMMRMPGTIPEGLVIDDLIQNIDLAPTLLDAAGLEIPPEIQGRSFWPAVTGGTWEPHREIPDESIEFRETYRNWLDIWPPLTEPRNREELFDVVADPEETHDLSQESGYESVRADLAARLDRSMTETNDPLLDGPIPDRLNSWPEPGGG